MKDILIQLIVILLRYSSVNERPHEVWSRSLQKQDTLLYQENNESMQLNLAQTRDNKYITITSVSRLCSEVRLLPLSMDMSCSPALVKEAGTNNYYYIDSAHDRLYILTNYLQENSNFQLMTASYGCSSRWEPFYIPDSNFILQDIELFNSFIVMYGNTRDPTLPVIIINNIKNETFHKIVLKDFTYVQKASNNYLSEAIKLTASSVISPPKHITISHEGDISFKNKTNFKLHLKHLKAKAKDGVMIPITLFYDSKRIELNGSNPMLMIAYGCHGVSLYTGYDETLLPLIRRGWILAYCHIRGGGELGRQWYFDAVKEKKLNSFNDLIYCANHLHRTGYSSPQLTALYGRSSGSLSVAGVCNIDPEITKAVILEMPLVNLMDNLLNGNHYINAMDSEEFGDPNMEGVVESICPFHNLRKQNYPSFLITASTIDPLVMYSSVERYVKRLKDCIEQYRATSVSDCHTEGMKRGTVIFHKETDSSHYWADSSAIQKQALLKLNFLINAVQRG
ncbi:PREDICTED: prolyl endopeptidase-like isoform X2 [Amphimedon queenslandica]|uniref:Prolyl endopeptidase n=1 Tax=Amphimedon queenslandica TaxID=400682 RepID=A0AAN0IQ69_AMPQE|nr:PREDICTED: prolyl endopeptidase-like isoform X2 [Amphimedon queenslandica]|eukprot:XP_011406687.2 PREDICTED: prolyl endopeptidase-like isoform X2 [Amphimedon queenslandica]